MGDVSVSLMLLITKELEWKCYQCQFDSFQFSVSDTYDSSVTVLFTRICAISTTLSAECPTDVTITPSTGTFEDGDVLTCSADGYNLTYTWSGTAANGAVTVSRTGSSYALPEGVFDLTCTASVSELTSCTGTASHSVRGDAVGCATGKYWIQLNTTLRLGILRTLSVSYIDYFYT